jgi:hypothetical protein
MSEYWLLIVLGVTMASSAAGYILGFDRGYALGRIHRRLDDLADRR